MNTQPTNQEADDILEFLAANQFRSLPDTELYRWVKVSDRLPTKRHNYHVRCKGFNGDIYNAARMFDLQKIYNTGSTPNNWDTNDEVIEWLEQVPIKEQGAGEGDLMPFVMYLTGYKEEQAKRIYENWKRNIKS